MLLPTNAHPGPLRAIVFFLKHRGVFKSPRPMEQTLPPALADRFAAARTTLRKPAKRYQGWKPAVAGMLLTADAIQPLQLAVDEPQARIKALARKAHAPTREVSSFNGSAVLDALLTISDAAQRDCLADELDQVEAGTGAMRAATVSPG